MTALPEHDISPEEEALLRGRLRAEADPGFLVRLRSESRGRHARLTRNLAWLDLDFELGPLRIVHDGELIHLVTNDPLRFRDYAGEQLGYVPEEGENKKVRATATEAISGKVPGNTISFLGELPRFQRQVLEATAGIPRGEVRPYGWVARQAGTPGAVRAAGTALAHNPVPFVIPCHRVVKADWDLGKYSAGGPAVKARVLRFEGIEASRLADLHARGVRYFGFEGGYFCIPGCGGEWGEYEPVRPLRSAAEAIAGGYRACSDCRPA